MTQYFTEEGSVQAVNDRMGPNINPRLAVVMAALVKHLHAFAKEVHLTQAEWDYGIDFLTKTGQMCSGERQEFILLSDVLGQSFKLRISSAALRTVDHRGGLDAFLAKAHDGEDRGDGEHGLAQTLRGCIPGSARLSGR